MRIKIVTGLALLTAMISADANAAASINGKWKTKDKDAIIEFGSCGTTVCGKISKYLKTPPNGVDQKDVNNPNKKLRTRKLLGAAIIYGLKEDGNVWRGTIYDPRSGSSYRSVVYKTKDGTLNVKGCLGPICQTQIWTASN
jgi:uncharacterized protein (DUF2147 family)